MNFSPLHSYVHRKFAEAPIPGVALGLLCDGLLHFRGFGYADCDRRIPITAQTQFAIGSMSKSFTALAVLRLAEENRLSLSDPVSRHLPVPLRSHGQDILIQHLLNHTSGFPDAEENFTAFGHGLPEPLAPRPDESWDDVFTHIEELSDWTFAEPGAKFHYCNTGFTLLAYIVEKIAGIPFEEYVHETILRPLGMARTRYAGALETGGDGTAVPHLIRDGRLVPSKLVGGRSISGAGGLLSTIDDMARYLRMFLGRGILDGHRVFSEGVVAAMQRPAVSIPLAGRSFGECHYGAGLATFSDFFQAVRVGHMGSVITFNSSMDWVPGTGCGAVVFSNGPVPTSRIGEFALALALGKDPWQHPVWRMERALEAVVGTYRSFRDVHGFDVALEKGVLSIKSSKIGLDLLAEPVTAEPGRLLCRVPNAGHQDGFFEFRMREGVIEFAFDRYLGRKYGAGIAL